MRSVLRRNPRRVCRWLRQAAYYVSILLVASFICCEVLDLDGSDFPVPSKSPRINLAESHDLPWSGIREVVADHHRPLLKPEHLRATAPVQVAVTSRVRFALPRAAPADPAASP
jgi:hypothetical protein